MSATVPHGAGTALPMTPIRFLRRWGGYLVFVIVFAIGCGLLSWWQWARNAEAQAEVNRVTANYDAAPVPVGTLLPTLGAWRVDDEWRPVSVRGRYLRADQTLARNRPLNGRVGFEVLVPLRMGDGRVLIVDRGWVALGNTQDVPRYIPSAPRGEVTVVARLRQSEPELPGRTAPRGQIPEIHVPTLAAAAGGRAYTGAYGLLDSETPAPSTALIAQPRPDPDLGPHISYALQWIAFGILAFVGLGWAVRRDRRIAREQAGEVLPPPRVRGRSDTAEEDALLDAASR